MKSNDFLNRKGDPPVKKLINQPFLLIVVCVLLLMITQTLCSLVAAAILGAQLNTDGMTFAQIDDALLALVETWQSAILLASDGLALAAIWIMARRRKQSLTAFTGLQPRTTPAILVLAAVAGLAMSFWSTIAVNLFPWPESWTQAYATASGGLRTARPVLDFLAMVLLAPLVEEMLFRGIIYDAFCCMVPAGAAVVFQGMLFGGIHGTIIWMLYAGFDGCVMGYVRKHTGSVRPCVLMHMAYNGTSYLFNWFAESFGDNGTAVFFSFLGSAFLLLLCLYGIYFRSGKEN